MARKKQISTDRRGDSLSRDRIIEASIAILDQEGESGLTFRALSNRLATGPGAIYWHIANKDELLIAACDFIVAKAMDKPLKGKAPEAIIRAIASVLFDAINERPWLGLAITRAPGQMPITRIFERLGQQICALGVPNNEQWAVTSALVNYIIGVSAQNATNAAYAKKNKFDSRIKFLEATATGWSQLDQERFPFIRNSIRQLRRHDDRKDFLAGINLFLKGLG